jgi:hypothetical protein
MTTLHTLYEGLALSPNDWQTRAVLADWYEEAGQQAVADCLRWMIRRHKRPYPSAAGSFYWFNLERTTTETDPESDIPEPVYRRLREGREEMELVFRGYDTLQAAEEDFHRAWGEARRQGWNDA